MSKLSLLFSLTRSFTHCTHSLTLLKYSDVDLKEIGDDFYFYVEIWAPGAAAASFPTCRLLHRAKDSRIPVQFGREVLAGVLGRPERAFWKACEVGKEAETESAEAFKQIFANFDPFSA